MNTFILSCLGGITGGIIVLIIRYFWIKHNTSNIPEPERDHYEESSQFLK